MLRSLLILLALLFGTVFSSYIAVFSYLSPYLIALMLFLPSLKAVTNVSAKINWQDLLQFFTIILLPTCFGVLIYLGLHLVFKQEDWLMSQILMSTSPVASGSTVMIEIIGGRVMFSLLTAIASNLSIVLFWPIIFKVFLGLKLSLASIFVKIAAVSLLPFVLAKIISLNKKATKIFALLLKFRFFAFYLWMLVVLINIASVADFLKNNQQNDWNQISIMIALATIFCFINFWMGGVIGKKFGHAKETSQLFGQKNTTIAIWVANQFFNPLVAICPIAYLVIQNFYNSWQLYLLHRKKQI